MFINIVFYFFNFVIRFPTGVRRLSFDRKIDAALQARTPAK